MLGALRRTIDQENRDGGRYHVDHADQRLLRQPPRPLRREGQEQRGDEREGERIRISGAALHRMTEHEGDGGAERRDLREREIDEDDLAAQHLDAEIGVNPDQAERDQERRPQQLKRVAHRPACAVSAATSASNSEM